MQPRYSALNQALHWITAGCMFAILPLAWVMTNADDKTPGLGAMYNWHKTLGMIVLLVTAFRVVWRFKDGPPPYPRPLAGWEKGLAHAAYWLFFAVMLWMPITGFVMSTFEGHATKLFNLIPTPLLWGKNHELGEQFGQLHAAGQWLIYALILVHLGAVAMHLIVRHDGALGRMLPADATEPHAEIAAAPTRH